MTETAYQWAAIQVLWLQEMKRFFRQPSRIIGALGQPLIFWLVIGSGFSGAFHLVDLDLDYRTFFFPGVVTMILVFASIFQTVSVIEDRRGGFLQAVLVSPASRGAIVLGKCVAASSVALLQAGLFLLLSPLAGVDLASINLPLLLSVLVCGSLGLSAMGFVMAWVFDNIQSYHAVQMTLLLPLWGLSGALFPAPAEASVFSWIMALNPVAYLVSALRRSLYAHTPDALTLLSHGAWDLLVVFGFAAVALSAAVFVCHRRP